ncbi:hypothetical protein DV736_g6620, partial [Chaetothyriales sp. CBS 134916]
MNTLTNTSTGYSPFYLLYGVHPRDDVAQEVSHEGRAHEGDRGIQTADDFTVYRQQIRKDTADALKLAQARMAIVFDRKHTPLRCSDLVYLKLAKGTKVGYKLPNLSALDINKVGLFKVKR